MWVQGLFAFTDIIVSSRKAANSKPRQIAWIAKQWPNRREYRESWLASLRRTALGGILWRPGAPGRAGRDVHFLVNLECEAHARASHAP